MPDPVSTGYGIEVAFASGFLAQITDVTLPEWAREKIDVSHTQSPDRRMEYIMADLVDSGELEVELNFDPAAEPPIDDDFEPVTVTFPSGTTWEFSGALMNYGGEAPLDDRMTATATLAITGKITITPAA
jgi:hypothetical protein